MYILGNRNFFFDSFSSNNVYALLKYDSVFIWFQLIICINIKNHIIIR